MGADSLLLSGSSDMRLPTAPMSRKLKTRLSYVYSEMLVMSGSTSSKKSGTREQEGMRKEEEQVKKSNTIRSQNNTCRN